MATRIRRSFAVGAVAELHRDEASFIQPITEMQELNTYVRSISIDGKQGFDWIDYHPLGTNRIAGMLQMHK
jgi:hypothetical protein